jgi:hypothetical protein
MEMFNTFWINSHLRYVDLILNQKIFGKVQNYWDKPIYIKLSGSDEK